MHLWLMAGKDEVKYFGLLPLQEAAHLAASYHLMPCAPTKAFTVNIEMKAMMYLTIVGQSCVFLGNNRYVQAQP